MNIPQIRRLVDSLKHKYADELEVYRLQPVAQKFCDDLANAVTGKKRRRPRSTHEWAEIFHKRVQERGLRPPPRVHLHSYLERCLDLRVLPQASGLLRDVLPSAAGRGLIPRSIQEPVSF